MIKILLLITLFVFINCIFIISAVKVILENINKNKKEGEKKEEDNTKYINFYLIAENHATYEAFCQVTLNLENIRDVSKKICLSEEDKEIMLKNIDMSLMELQNLLYNSQIDIPDPTVLTKSYLQNMIVKTLEIRVLYESLIGNSIIERAKEDYNKDARILNIVPKEDNNGK